MKDELKTKAQLIDELKALRTKLSARSCNPLPSPDGTPSPGQGMTAGELNDDICQQAPVAFFCVTAADGQIKVCNRSACDLLGYDTHTLLGMPVLDLYAEGPTGQEKAKKIFGRFVDGKSVNDEELQMRQADGSSIWVSLSISPVLDSDGLVLESRSIVVDITARKEAEKELQASESRTRTIFESVRVGVLVQVASGEITYANKVAEEMFQFPVEKIRQKTSTDPEWQMILEDGTPVSGEEHPSMITLKTGKPLRNQVRGLFAGDPEKTRWMLINTEPVFRKDEQLPVEVIITFSNITELKVAERALQHSENLFRKVFDLLPVGLWIADRNGQLLEANPTGVKIWGGSPLVPQDDYAVFKARRLPSGEEIAPEEWAMVHTVNEGVTIADELLEIDAFDGVTRTILNYSAPVLDDDGKIMAAIAMNNDITEQRKVEEMLRESEERYRSYVDNAPFGVFIVDERGTYQDVNRTGCEITGYSRTELLTMSASDLVPEQERTVARQNISQALETGRASRQGHFLTKSGEERSWSVEAVRLSENRVLGFVTDITERNLAEEQRELLEHQLHQSQRMEAVGRLAGGVAHDFNNLLTVITGFSELLLDGLNPSDPMLDDVSEILAASHTAATLTEQLLAFSRQQIIAPRVLNLNQKMPPMQKMLQRLIGEDIDVVYDIADHLWTIRFDPGQMDQVLVNLAVNARDAMERGGTLTLKAKNIALAGKALAESSPVTEGEYVLIEVHDTGSGMDHETMDRMFDPFFTTKEVGRGTGLGLATVYGILEQNNSYIKVISDLDQGSTFRIFIPRFEGTVEDVAEDDQRIELKGSETILLVEDQDMVRNLTQRVLQHHGYKVIPARDGGEALLFSEQFEGKIDLILTDMVMPKMSGKAMMEQLNRFKPGLRVLYMSGYTDDAIARHGILEEGDNFLQKPFHPKELALRVRQALDT